MTRGKQYVFSSHTTEEGLKILNDLKAKLGVTWEDLVIDAVNAHYQVSAPKPPKAAGPKKERPPKKEKKPKAEGKAEGEKAEAAKVEPRKLPEVKGE